MEYLYPGGLAKAITFSYDDGQVYDRRPARATAYDMESLQLD